MPNPFPGMNPFLEQRHRWPSIHHRLIIYIADDLQAALSPNYVAVVNERVQLATPPPTRAYIPDVAITETHSPSGATLAPQLLVADSPQVALLLEEERPVPYIDIVDAETHKIVTVLEILSPANKEGEGREQYLQKQRDVLRSTANLVEIDLLGYGRNTVLARNLIITQPIDWRYIVCVSRAARRNALEYYPFSVKQRFPRCRIPLLPTDPDVVLDLPTVFNRVYDVGRYDLLVDYEQMPQIGLSEQELVWIKQQLVESKLTGG